MELLQEACFEPVRSVVLLKKFKQQHSFLEGFKFFNVY